MDDGIERVSGETVSFGSFRLHRSERYIEKSGIPVPLGARALDILLALVDQAGAVVSKKALLQQAWRDTTVNEGSLRVQINILRKALGDDRSGTRYIASVAGQGYSFVARVSRTIEQEEPKQVPAIDRVDLPARLGRMVGRGPAIAAISGRLLDQRFVTIVGPGGIGKTTVAVAVGHELAREFEHGVRFYNFSALNDPELVLSTIASSFGIPTQSKEASADLMPYLRHRRLLIILDCCEHLIDAVAAFSERIFRDAPQVHLLATSREPLRVEGEHVHRLSALETPPAGTELSAYEAGSFPVVQLFVDRAAASSGHFLLTDALAPMVAEICRRLDGIPLAIELAAARTAVFGVSAIAERLGDLFSLLTDGHRTALPRHQTLRATLDWSYQLLPLSEQVVLRRLSIFRGKFLLESAVSLCSFGLSSSDEVRGAIGNLAAKSLLAADFSGELAHYRLLDTTRAYAAEKLADSGEKSELIRRHALLCRDHFINADTNWELMSRERWLELYADFIDDLRAALEWSFSPGAEVSVGIAITSSSAPLWFALSLFAEYCDHAERALKRVAEASLLGSEVEMKLRLSLGVAVFNARGPVPTMASAPARALEIAEQLGATTYQFRALWQLARERSTQGDYPAALEFCQRFDKLAKTHGDPAVSLVRDRMMALGLYFVGRHAEARLCAENAINNPAASIRSAHKSFNEYDNRVASRTHLSRILWMLGYHDQAASLAAEAIDHGLKLGYRPATCYVLTYAACPFAIWTDNRPEMTRYFQILREQSADLPFGYWKTWLHHFEQVAALGKNDGTSSFQLKVEAIAESLHGPYSADVIGTFREELVSSEAAVRAASEVSGCYAPEMLRARGENLLRAANDVKQAEAHFRCALKLARRQNALSWELRAATSLARLWNGRDRREQARTLLTEVYSRLTEGFDGADLREARRVLDEL